MFVPQRLDIFQAQEKTIQRLKALAEAHHVQQPHIEYDPFGCCPLTAVLCFRTQWPQSFLVSVEKWSWVTEKTTIHCIPILTLPAGRPCDVVLENTGGERFSFVLEAHVDEAWPIAEFSSEHLQAANTLYFLLPADGVHKPAAYDRDGHCRWLCTHELSHGLWRHRNGHLLVGAPPQPAAPFGPTALWEMDLLGRVYREWRFPYGFEKSVVDLAGKQWVAVSQLETYGTTMDALVWLDQASGEALQTFPFKHSVAAFPGSPAQSGTDWFHADGLCYDEAEHALWVSGQMQNVLLKINAEQGEIERIYAKAGNKPPQAQVLPLPEAIQDPADLVVAGDQIYLASAHRFDGHRKFIGAPPSICVIDAQQGDLLEEWTDLVSGHSPILNRLQRSEKDFWFHAGGLSSATGKIPGLFAAYEDKDVVCWSEGCLLTEGRVSGRYRFGAAAYGMLPLQLSDCPCHIREEEGAVMGAWALQAEVDIEPAVHETTSDCTDLALRLWRDDARLYVEGVYYQGESCMLILQKGAERRRFFMQTNRRPYGADWLKSINSGPQRPVIWATPITHLKGDWAVLLQIDDVEYETGYILRTSTEAQ